MRDYGTPVLALCGFSGSGKTTLLEAVLPKLVERGLAVAVVKHDEHGFQVDHPGKDSDRFFRCGATVALSGPAEQFLRRHGASALDLNTTLLQLAADHDLILVEGHKYTPLPKLWVQSADRAPIPESVTEVIASLEWDSDRPSAMLNFLQDWLPRQWCMRSLHCGVLLGASRIEAEALPQSSQPAGAAVAEAFVELRCGGLPIGEIALLGGDVPAYPTMSFTHLPPVPDASGEMAALLAAHRWAPRSAWMIVSSTWLPCNLAEVRSLIAMRRPGCWAIVSHAVCDGGWPALAIYEPQAMQHMERLLLADHLHPALPGDLLRHPRTVTLHREQAR